MPLDPFALAASGAFTAGCVSIHALRRHPDAVAFVLAVLAYGLATAVGSMLAARSGMVMVHDPMGGQRVVVLTAI